MVECYDTILKSEYKTTQQECTATKASESPQIRLQRVKGHNWKQEK